MPAKTAGQRIVEAAARDAGQGARPAGGARMARLGPIGRLKRLRLRLGMNGRETAAILAIMAVAVATRFVNLPARGMWGQDQGTETWAIRNAVVTGQLPTFGSQAYSVGGVFHHGALFYDLMMPAAWLGGGNPTYLAFEIALFGLIVVPLVWWTARSIGGAAAGLAAALLAAVSPSLIDYSTFVWNPVLTQPGAALACFGAWQAWRTRDPRWWVAAAAGTAMATHSHLTGGVLVLPMSVVFLLALRRGPSGVRRRLIGWGIAGVAVFVFTWLPLIAYELGHNFAETRGMLTFDQGSAAGADPFTRVLVAGLRILAWPFTYWPLDGLKTGIVGAFAVAVAVALGLVWRLAGTFGKPSGNRPADDRAVAEREGIRFVAGTLAAVVLVLGLAIKDLSIFTTVNQEQYHTVADPVVILAAGLVLGGLWKAAPLRRWPRSGRVVASIALASLVAVSAGHWPPLTAVDGGWPAAQSATQRLERAAGAQSLALVGLPGFESTDAYGYALYLDNVKTVAPGSAETVAILCDTGWYQGCGGAAEDAWIAENGAGRGFQLVDRFSATPDHFLSVYRRTP
jgi:4-amino-4-deoxy-L-arabinose transferase-like glycosyltransferase